MCIPSLARCYTIYNVLCNVWDSVLILFKMDPKSKYVVAFAQEGPIVRIAELPEDVQAVQFAINLHRSSNLKHSVFVFENDIAEPLIVFTLK